MRFGSVATDYDAHRPTYPDALYDAIDSYAGGLRGLRTLDVGAGSGIATRALVERGAKVTATDVDPQMLAVLRARDDDVAVVVARGEALPYAAATFALATCATAWHWMDAGLSARELTRVLAPGGVLAVWWGFAGLAPCSETGAEHEAFQRWRAKEEDGPKPPNREDPLTFLSANGFVEVRFEEHRSAREVTVEDHIQHVCTHSPVLAIGAEVGGLQADLRAVFADRDTVTENLHCALTLARRP
ncbi:MAG: hypothetical protein QOG53_2885 [Frankiales bacterium]|jgi:SAM-dependent methyltransferase|nr:hypothetical protein [Frankiales bacterium]